MHASDMRTAHRVTQPDVGSIQADPDAAAQQRRQQVRAARALPHDSAESCVVLQLAHKAMWVQTKETLTLRASSFGSKCELPERFLKKVLDSGVADRVLSFASFKQNKEMKKSDGSKRQRITGMTWGG